MKQTKFKDYEKAFTFPVFSKYWVHIIFTDDIKRSAKARYGVSRKLENCDGAHHFDDSGHSHLFYRIRYDEDYAPHINTLVHEAYHAVYALLVDWAGLEKLDEELVAYHLGYIMEQVIKFQILVLEDVVKKLKSGNRKQTHESK